MMYRYLVLSLTLMAMAVASISYAQDAAKATTDASDADPTAAAIAKAVGEVESAVEAYVAAFNKADAKAVAALWSPGGVYTSRTSGQRIVGRQAMEKDFGEILAGDNPPKLSVATESVELISPSVALERGTATVVRGDSASQSNYSAVYVKQDGKWLVDRVTEDDIVVEQSKQNHLQGLDWLVGSWVDDTEGVRIEITCRYTENENFLSRTYSVSTPDGIDSSGLQIIGWDAKEKTVRSWLFDSNGGVVQGTWNQNGDDWVVQSVVTLADGASGSFTSIFSPQDDGNYTWKKINRVLDGNLLPNLDEVVVVRQ